MRTAPLKLRQFLEASGSLAMSVWLLPDFSIVHQKQTHDEYIRGAFAKPEPTARMVLAAGGRRRLDTVDGRPHFGDAWEENGFLYVQTGDDEDFDFEENDQLGRGQQIQSRGNWIEIPLSAFAATKPYTLRTAIPNIVIANDVLEVTDTPILTRAAIDKKFRAHHSISFDAASVGSAASASSVTVAHTVGVGDNRHLFTTVNWTDASETPVSCVFNTSEAMGSIGSASTSGRRLESYGLVAPSSTTANVVGTKSGAAGLIRLVSTSRFGVNQITPNRTYFSFTSASTATPSITVTDSQNTDCVIDALMDAGNTLTADASQSERSNAGGGACQGQSDEIATGANTVMSWTISAATAVAYGAVALIEAPTGFGLPLGGHRNNPVHAMG